MDLNMDLQKIFVYVPSSYEDKFITTVIEVDSEADKYADKVVFLERTNRLWIKKTFCGTDLEVLKNTFESIWKTLGANYTITGNSALSEKVDGAEYTDIVAWVKALNAKLTTNSGYLDNPNFDDGVVCAGNKKTLWLIRDAVHKRMEMMHLSVKPNKRIFPVRDGIDFLGYVIYGDSHVRLRKRNKKRAARRLHKVKSKRRRKEIIAALYGLCKHADCNNLFKKITNEDMSKYQRLSDLGIKPKYADGKKRFTGNEVNLADLVGEYFVIMDFETGIVTGPQKKDYEQKVERQRRELENYTTHGITPPQGFLYPDNVPYPTGKYLISIKRYPETENEVDVKAFTGDRENMSILDQIKEEGKLGSALCSVNAVRCRGYMKNVLC